MEGWRHNLGCRGFQSILAHAQPRVFIRFEIDMKIIGEGSCEAWVFMMS